MIGKKRFNFNIIINIVFFNIVFFLGNGLLCVLPDDEQSMSPVLTSSSNFEAKNFNDSMKQSDSSQNAQVLIKEAFPDNNMEIKDNFNNGSIKELAFSGESLITKDQDKNLPLEGVDTLLYEFVKPNNTDDVVGEQKTMNIGAIYSNIKNTINRKLEQYASESDVVISQGRHDVDRMPEMMVHAKHVAGNVADNVVNGVQEVKLFLESPEVKDFFNKSLHTLNVFCGYVNGKVTAVANNGLDLLLKKSSNPYGPPSQYTKDTQGIIEPTLDTQGIIEPTLVSNVNNEPASQVDLPFYMYDKKFILKSMGGAMLIVGLPTILYKYRHHVKLFGLKIKNLFLGKRYKNED